jgi:hypothetical protein
MVSATAIEDQLKRIGFNYHGWGRTEVRELQNIIMPDEEISESVNGIYEGGFALLLATDVRVLLVDKKPLNYLTVEDVRFDMINEIDYSHRLIGAYIKISAGEMHLKFSSLNQARLRRLIEHVQRAMADAKKKQSYHQEGQTQHLERINEQLRTYLLAQYEQQQKLQNQLRKVQTSHPQVEEALEPTPELNPSPELADYLLAQSLLARHKEQTEKKPAVQAEAEANGLPNLETAEAAEAAPPTQNQLAELHAEGVQEVFGKHTLNLRKTDADDPQAETAHTLEVSPMRIAYAKLPMALRNRKFGRPLFHAHSQEGVSVPAIPTAEA